MKAVSDQNLEKVFEYIDEVHGSQNSILKSLHTVYYIRLIKE